MKAKRLKVLILTTHVSFADLVLGLQKLPFNEQSRVGLEFVEISETRAVFRYHEQRAYTQSFVNPLGETIESSYSLYINFEMSVEDIGGDRFSISISAPPKDLKPFVDLLRTATSSTFALEVVKPDIMAFYDQLKSNRSLTRVMAKRIVSGSINFDIESSYRVDIASTANAMTKLLEITGGRAAPIDKIKIAYQYDHTPVSVELSRSGSIAVVVDDEEHLQYIIGLLIR
ncbi:hypothetical protein SAMN05444064_10114 [Pseudomonas syringae]|uniref:hypothetical protein n=1 Tax=Pseudomonas syringae TaxID=317 RepID=UPI000895875C|nr:hypothetical protein [Pseudomonas syringae]SDW00206.1 hypothetical protein SAMN05444514_10116 [Pseudomonas syringae]SFL34574.1 hypothetical protein SAMN05444064_10114 [Pseudomonas syringae]